MAAVIAGSITTLFDSLRAGDSDSARALWSRFFPRLVQIARQTLAGRELPVGAEDAVQEAFFKFFRRVEQGGFTGELHRDDLWRLLILMTSQIASKQRRRELTAKRGGGMTRLEADCRTEGQIPLTLDTLWGEVAPPDCDLICQDLLNLLDTDVREIALLRLAGYTVLEMKEIVGYPVRSIERRLQLIRSIWSDYALR